MEKMTPEEKFKQEILTKIQMLIETIQGLTETIDKTLKAIENELYNSRMDNK